MNANTPRNKCTYMLFSLTKHLRSLVLKSRKDRPIFFSLHSSDRALSISLILVHQLHFQKLQCKHLSESLNVVPCILYEFINYYQQMHYIAIKITQITVFYVIIRAPTCFDPPGSSSGSSECLY